MPIRTQANRIAAVGTPLGDDVLLLAGLHGTEELGRPFQYDLDLLSEDASIDFDQIVGHNISVRYELPDQTTRYFNGFVSRFVQTSADGRTASYQATMVPWLWFLTRTGDCRIFQNKTVPDIVKAVCAAHGFNDIDESLSGTYGAWDYCVQYRETDFNFVSRLLEQEGIYYYFKHTDGQHTMVLCDSPAAHSPADGFESVAYRAPSGDVTIGYVTAWSLAHQVEPATYALTDYDFTKPKASLMAKSQVARGDAYAAAEVYDYPGEYKVVADGEEYAKVRIQELQARYEVASASTDQSGLLAGHTFTLTDHPRDDQNRQYLITSATCQITGDEFDSAAGGSDGGRSEGPSYACHFTAVDAQTPYRPARVTPKPTVAGPQTAVVVGPAGQEIYTDPYARVKVQFMWDRLGQADENSSCWIRVAQVWAGRNWGGIYNPRVGQEVIVDFLEGDPDQPIITGRVYNGVEKPPYPLPDRQTMSTIKSNSSPGGGGFNELRFEDKKGSEQIFVHGEKNQDVRIKNDSLEWVGNDRHLVVVTDQLEHVQGAKHLTVDGDRNTKIGGDDNLTIGGDQTAKVTGHRHLSVQGDRAQLFSGDDSREVKGNLNEKVGKTVSMNAGTDLQQKVGQNFAVDAGMTVHIKAGMSLVIEAGVELTIKAGSNFINIGPAGVAIQGTLVMINSGGAAGSGNGCKVTDPAAPVAPEAPKAAKEAADADTGSSDDAKSASPFTALMGDMSAAAKVAQMASDSGSPFFSTGGDDDDDLDDDDLGDDDAADASSAHEETLAQASTGGGSWAAPADGGGGGGGSYGVGSVLDATGNSGGNAAAAGAAPAGGGSYGVGSVMSAMNVSGGSAAGAAGGSDEGSALGVGDMIASMNDAGSNAAAAGAAGAADEGSTGIGNVVASIGDAGTAAASPASVASLAQSATATAADTTQAQKLTGDVLAGLSSAASKGTDLAAKGDSFIEDAVDALGAQVGASDLVKTLAKTAVKAAVHQATQGGGLSALGTDALAGIQDVVSPDAKQSGSGGGGAKK